MTRNKQLTLITLLSILVLVLLSSGMTQAQSSESTCQIYHLSVEQARIRSCAGEDCPVIGGATQSDTLCIRGVAEADANWLEIDLDPQNNENQPGFIRRDLVVPGEPGTNPNVFSYCDAWQVIPAEAVIRARPSTSADVLGSLTAGAQICVEDYYYLYSGWSAFTQPATGQSGWVNSSNIRYVYDESLGCEESREVIADSAIYSCAGTGCATESRLAVGSRLCLGSEVEEEGLWVSFKREDGSSGWIRMDLLQPVEGEPQTVAQVSTEPAGTPTALPTLQPLGGAPLAICPVGASPVDPGACATVTPTALPQTNLPGNGLTLARNVTISSLLFANEIDLNSPQARTQIFFRLPSDWVVSDPLTMVLNMNYVESQANLSANNQISSQLSIRLNNEIVAFANLNSSTLGAQTLEVPLPARLIEKDTNLLQFDLEAVDFCNLNAQSRLTINGQTSYVTFVYEESLPIIDLAYYPRPFYNNPLREDLKTVWLVIPDAPSDTELAALAGIAGGLGSLSERRLNVRTIGVSEITPEIWSGNHFIVIGRPDTNALIANLYQRNSLPTSYDGQQLSYNGSPISASDGVVQIASHPDNPARAVLVVTSASDEGLLKAGQSLAGPTSLLNLTGPVSVIFDTRSLVRTAPQETQLAAPALYSLSDLGVATDIVLTGSGIQIATFDFRLPIGGLLREDAYIELLFSSSEILSQQDSSLNILINGNPIAGVPLSAGTVDQSGVQQTGYQRLRAAIPASAVNPGLNEVALLVDMKGNWGCELPEADVIWTSISRSSTVFLPQVPVPAASLFQTVAQFPVPFNILGNLEDLIIQMPDAPSKAEVQQLASLMAYLGASNPLSEGLRPIINRGAFAEGTDLSRYNIISLGRPTNNQFLRDINSNLPQPFMAGTDDLEQVYDDVSYRLMPGLNVGVIQILPSPWNGDRSVLVITGTSEIGQVNALNTLLNLPFGPDPLKGNIVFTTESDATAVDTRYIFEPQEILDVIPQLSGIAQAVPQLPTATPEVVVMVITSTPEPTVATSTPGAEPTSEPTLIFTSTPADAFTTPLPQVQPLSQEQIQNVDVERPQWVSILIGVSVVMVALALIYNMIATVWQRRKKDE